MMIFRLFIDRDKPEEVTATVHARTPLVDEIERLVLQDDVSDQIPGYIEDDILMLNVAQVEYFVVENEKTYAQYSDRKRYLVRKRLYELEKELPGNFERISKSALANWKAITRFKVQLSGAVDAVFKSGYVECISRRCFAELKRRYGL
ncbi:MAG: LytTR family transcriptional regulator [Clostridia bacterium]|nr:LytTR family transcriptional regulator [Clostridia bacterium]